MRYRLWAALMLLLAIAACNAPSRPVEETPVHLQPATSIIGATATQPANPPTEQIVLPDIEGTVNAQASATTDPDTPANISGVIIYPADSHPTMRVYALRTDGQRYEFVEVRANDGRYTIQVPAGEYYILADTEVGDGAFESGYTELSKCLRDGGDCPSASHNLIAILAQAGQIIEDIDLRDWVEDGSIFPDVPG
jgi:hypothetical protein